MSAAAAAAAAAAVPPCCPAPRPAARVLRRAARPSRRDGPPSEITADVQVATCRRPPPPPPLPHAAPAACLPSPCPGTVRRRGTALPCGPGGLPAQPHPFPGKAGPSSRSNPTRRAAPPTKPLQTNTRGCRREKNRPGALDVARLRRPARSGSRALSSSCSCFKQKRPPAGAGRPWAGRPTLLRTATGRLPPTSTRSASCNPSAWPSRRQPVLHNLQGIPVCQAAPSPCARGEEMDRIEQIKSRGGGEDLDDLLRHVYTAHPEFAIRSEILDRVARQRRGLA